MNSITLKTSGETITFIKTGKDTNGAFTEIICTVPARQKGPPSHIHPLQDENFEVIEGKLELHSGGKKFQTIYRLHWQQYRAIGSRDGPSRNRLSRGRFTAGAQLDARRH